MHKKINCFASTVSNLACSVTSLVSCSMQSRGVVVPQVFRMNLRLEMNIELSDST